MRLSGDPFEDFDRHESEWENLLAKLPRCSICDEPIQEDHYYCINGETICAECLDNNYKRTVDCDD